MTKQEQKDFRTILYEQYGHTYMDDRASVEALYIANFKWVERMLKLGFPPKQIIRDYSVMYHDMLFILNVFIPKDYMSEANRHIATHSLCTYRHEHVGRLLSVGYTAEEVRDMLQDNYGLRSYQIDAMVEFLANSKLKGKLYASDFFTHSKNIGKTATPPPVMRGEPFHVSEWKREREKVIDLRKKAVSKNPQLEYELHRLNWLIGDNQPKGGRVLRLKTLQLAKYPTYIHMLELREKVQQCIKENKAIIDASIRGGYGRIWMDALQEWRNPYEVIQEIERVIKHCGGESLSYGDFYNDAIERIAKAWGLTADKLKEPLPPVDPAIKERYKKVFGDHLTPRIMNPYLDEIYKSFAEHQEKQARKTKQFPGGYMVIGGADAPNPLRSNISSFVIYDCNEQGAPIDWEVYVKERNKARTFTNTALGEPYTDDLIKKCDVMVDVKRGPFNTASFDFKHNSYEKMLNELGYNYLEPIIPFADWKKLAELSRTAALATLDEIKERYGLNQRPTIALALALKDRISQPINKIKSEMENMNNAAGPMTKEQKRIRIKELEDALVNIKKHKAQIAEVEARQKQHPALILRTELTLMNSHNSGVVGFTMFGQDFMKPEIMLKIYKVELDEEETRMTTELNALIA